MEMTMFTRSELSRLANKYHQANKYYDYTPAIFTFHKSASIKANIHVILEPLPAHCNNYPTQNLVPNLALGSAQMSEYI